MKQKKNINKYTFASMAGYIPVVLWVAFTFILVAWVVFASFSTSAEIYSDHMFEFRSGFHFDNYARAWNAQKVSVIFLNSLIYTTIACTAVVLIGSPAAYVLSRFKFRGNTVIQNLFAAALGIPAIMLVMPLFSLASVFRIVGNRWLLQFLYIGMNIPFAVFFMLAFFRNLSLSYEESAAIDGCSQYRTFWNIMFPLAQPGLVTLTIFNFITIWNDFFISMIFGNKPAIRPVALGLYYMVQSMRYTSDWGGMFAAVVIVFLPTFVLYIFLSDKIIKGVTAGAIKG